MNEQFDPAEIRAVASAMREFESRCEKILTLLGEKRILLPSERDEVEQLYKSLKNDLREASKYGTLSQRRVPLTRAEQCFYDPAVRRAAINLRPATNSHPVSSHWVSAVFEAQSEFTYWLQSLAELPDFEV